uniref:sulfite exporter TauE/SafE family protein n=1 Tax=Enterocloster clostridioformis TaxID=1531 RepID=UPI0025A5670F|nr:sulfite exporter TauE/SafE family protein [Enterocloster clostridioformis]
MVFWMIVMAANLVVGAFVGLTGVAGFLLPIVYTGPLGRGVTEGLALSFAAFIVSGALGSVNYNKAGNLDIPFGIRLSLGSLAGAVLGVILNLIIPESTVKVILYVVVLLSGISILLRKDKRQEEGGRAYVISDHLAATLILGFVTGAVCSLSGAGGPVLVMPLLVVLGIGIRTAVGVALFNSVFIGIPACIGYMMQCSVKDILPVMAAALVFHGIGVVYGSRNAVKINQILLKKGIAVFSILIAIWKLAL